MKGERRLITSRTGPLRTDKHHLIMRKSGQTSVWSFITRNTRRTGQGGNADGDGKNNRARPAEMVAGALHGMSIGTPLIGHKQPKTAAHSARIVKATQAGRWGKCPPLTLVHHLRSAAALAVRRVTENWGSPRQS